MQDRNSFEIYLLRQELSSSQQVAKSGTITVGGAVTMTPIRGRESDREAAHAFVASFSC